MMQRESGRGVGLLEKAREGEEEEPRDWRNGRQCDHWRRLWQDHGDHSPPPTCPGTCCLFQRRCGWRKVGAVSGSERSGFSPEVHTEKDRREIKILRSCWSV